MFKKGLAILSFLSFSIVFAQKITIEKKDFVSLNASEFVGFDAFRNYFYLKDNVIYKKTDVELLQYQNLALGKIAKLWLFNTLNQQIGLYDLTTNQYQNLGIPINDGFQYYQTDFNYFHWIDKQNNWFTCTIFGRIISNGKTEFASKSKFINENKILFAKDDKLFLSDLSTNKTYEIEIVEKTFQKFYYKDQILSIFTDQGITNYKITLP
jgi:hypothetical protein